MELAAQAVSKHFSGVYALSDVTARFAKGEIVGLIGPNGSGKTTLINVLSGVIPPSGGSIRLGDDVWSDRTSFEVARSGIARTFQTIRLFEEMTVIENLEVAASCSSAVRGGVAARRAASDAIDALNLGAVANSLASTLSYGLQRRVEMARAVAAQPHFVLLDEPAAGLNEVESDELLSLIVGLRDSFGFGIVLIDHDLRLIMRGTQHIFVLNEGHLLAEGTPEVVRHDPHVIEAYLGTASTTAPSSPSPRPASPSEEDSPSTRGDRS